MNLSCTTAPNMNYILVSTVMLNGIIIINWISNGLLLVVQVMQSTRAAETPSYKKPNKYPTKVRYLKARSAPSPTHAIWAHCFHLAFVLVGIYYSTVPHQAVIYQIFWRCLFACSRQPKWSSAFEATRKMNILYQASTHFALFLSHCFRITSNSTNGTITQKLSIWYTYSKWQPFGWWIWCECVEKNRVINFDFQGTKIAFPFWLCT